MECPWTDWPMRGYLYTGHTMETAAIHEVVIWASGKDYMHRRQLTIADGWDGGKLENSWHGVEGRNTQGVETMNMKESLACAKSPTSCLSPGLL